MDALTSDDLLRHIEYLINKSKGVGVLDRLGNTLVVATVATDFDKDGEPESENDKQEFFIVTVEHRDEFLEKRWESLDVTKDRNRLDKMTDELLGIRRGDDD